MAYLGKESRQTSRRGNLPTLGQHCRSEPYSPVGFTGQGCWYGWFGKGPGRQQCGNPGGRAFFYGVGNGNACEEPPDCHASKACKAWVGVIA